MFLDSFDECIDGVLGKEQYTASVQDYQRT